MGLEEEVFKKKIYVMGGMKMFANKNFYPQIVAIFNNYCDGDGKLLKEDMRQALSYCLGWSEKKQDVALSTIENTGIIVDGNSLEGLSMSNKFDEVDGYYLSGFMYRYKCAEGDMTKVKWIVDGEYINNAPVNPKVLFSVMENIDDSTMKLYIYLLLQNRYWKKKGSNYRFCIRGESGLLSKLGYAQSNNTAKRVSDRLATLSNLGYIRHTDPHPMGTRFGKPVGQVMELREIVGEIV